MRRLAIIVCSLVLTVLASGQTERAAISARPPTDGRPPAVRYWIHNNSQSPLTAFIAKANGPTADHFSWDSVAQGGEPIPPGGEMVANGARLVVAVFADGSTAGDADWAKLIRMRRQYQFEALGDALDELEARGDRSGPELVSYLEAIEAKRVSAARATANSANRAAATLVSFHDRQLFEETTPELKVANILAESEGARVSAITGVYFQMKMGLGPTPPAVWRDLPEAERIQRVRLQFRTIRAGLSAADPELR